MSLGLFTSLVDRKFVKRVYLEHLLTLTRVHNNIVSAMCNNYWHLNLVRLRKDIEDSIQSDECGTAT
ncbi:hypothetical protein Mapa_009115 [Marchantia paleacea]|nr:hypothetical protein Mapa_009115 [Marchantia paleacea]